MKPALMLIYITMALIVGISCSPTNGKEPGKDGEGKPVYYSSADSAALHAKSDLLEVLRSNKNIALDINADALEKSQPTVPSKQYQLTFESLNATDSLHGFGDLSKNQLSDIVPLVADNNVVTIVEIARDEKGYRVASLASKEIANELNAVRRAIGDSNQGEIIIYNLPNERSKLYGVMMNNTQMFFTSYPGFNIREAVPAQRLIPILKKDAAEFQRRYGDDLKKQKLVH
jgi:hypothetical protein